MMKRLHTQNVVSVYVYDEVMYGRDLLVVHEHTYVSICMYIHIYIYKYTRMWTRVSETTRRRWVRDCVKFFFQTDCRGLIVAMR